MKRLRSMVLLATATVTGAACSFPDVNFASAADGSVGPEDASLDGPEASVGDVRVDATPDPCDVDRDHYRAQGGVCGGLDCDDTDPRRNPGVTTFLTYPTTNGDWNCDTVIDKQYPINVSCGSILVQGTCASTSGFSDDPGCGSSSTNFVTCVWDLGALPPGCKVGMSTSQTQGCK